MVDLRRILLVEDSSKDVELTLAGLAESHLANQVDVARDGAEAVDYLYGRGKYEGAGPGHPVVMLLDLKMPKVDGLEVLRRMKGDPQLKSIPVVMMTSSREETDLAECYKLGVNSFVVKPAEFHAFVDAVKKVGHFWAVINEPPPESLRKAT